VLQLTDLTGRQDGPQRVREWFCAVLLGLVHRQILFARGSNHAREGRQSSTEALQKPRIPESEAIPEISTMPAHTLQHDYLPLCTLGL
jgi:hypothetical protein